jgi:hypothetical protein
MTIIAILGLAIIAYLSAGVIVAAVIIKSGVIRKELGLFAELLTVIYIIPTWPKSIRDMGVLIKRKPGKLYLNFNVEVVEDESKKGT